MSPEQLAARRRDLESSAELQSLADRLQRLAMPLCDEPIYIPEQKALLSRDGGVCPHDGSRLSFDPWSPQRHRCPRCGSVNDGERHHRAWIWRYHIWLSERAIHLALLGTLRRDVTLLSRAYEIVRQYALRYRTYPNHDNVLGPTRLFFSTYLESIWLLQLVCAALFVRTAQSESVIEARDWSDFDDMVDESAGLIASFDEGWSNRQVWNNSALVAAGLWHSADAGQSLLLHGLGGDHGLLAQLTSCVTDSGLWYEGENYHFFALRGFLIAAELLRCAGFDLYGEAAPAGKLCDMYAAPLATALPDLTLPARGDAPFGVTLLQPRFAELWEVGWARTGDRRLESVLSQLYSADAPRDADRGASELAEQEQNFPPSRIHRSLLGWKALWCMNPAPPAAPPDTWQEGSKLLAEAGVAVMRPSSGRYVSVECGGRPGGHGHPDLLHLTLFWNRPRAVDMGTGSYVSPSLHWYRSTLAHNAPGVSGIGQLGRDAWCSAFEVQHEWAWCRAIADGVLGDGTMVTRTVIVGPCYVVDKIDVEAGSDVIVDLPIHVLSPRQPELAHVESLRGASSVHDDALGSAVLLEDAADVAKVAASFDLLLEARVGEQLLAAERPGPPDIWFADGAPVAFLVRRASGKGTWTQCWIVGEEAPVRLSTAGRKIRIEYRDGTADTFELRPDECRIEDRHGQRFRLAGQLPRPRTSSHVPSRHRRVKCPQVDQMPSVEDWDAHVPSEATYELGAESYRRSELVHGDDASFRARAAVFVFDDRTCFAVDVTKREPCFRLAEEPDPALDNEVPDIHSDGLQCYIGMSGKWDGYLVVPDPRSDEVRVAVVGDRGRAPSSASGSWMRTPGGYRVLVWFGTGRRFEKGDEFLMNLVVNEMYPERQRRAGQLALSGGGGWVYLRGDREHPSYALLAEVS